MYCGNNGNDPDIRSGRKQIGNRYSCFKQGIGIGLNLPVDPSFMYEYIPIDSRKMYCGKSNILPVGYDILGNNSMCLQKGVGVGKGIKADKERKIVRSKRKSRNNSRKHKSKRKSRKSRKKKSVRKRKSKSRTKKNIGRRRSR